MYGNWSLPVLTSWVCTEMGFEPWYPSCVANAVLLSRCGSCKPVENILITFKKVALTHAVHVLTPVGQEYDTCKRWGFHKNWKEY